MRRLQHATLDGSGAGCLRVPWLFVLAFVPTVLGRFAWATSTVRCRHLA